MSQTTRAAQGTGHRRARWRRTADGQEHYALLYLSHTRRARTRAAYQTRACEGQALALVFNARHQAQPVAGQVQAHRSAAAARQICKLGGWDPASSMAPE